MFRYIALLALAPVVQVSAVTLISLGDLPGGEIRSEAIGVSDDGKVVVGNSWSELGKEAFVWTEEGGIESLGDLPEGANSSEAIAVSADGSVVLGNFHSETSVQPFLWTEAEGFETLGDLMEGDFDVATGMSADGAIVVGYSHDGDRLGSIGFRWTADGVADLSYEGPEPYEALGISRDGTFIVGNIIYGEDLSDTGKEVTYLERIDGEFAEASKFISREAFVWNESSGFELLEDTTDYYYEGGEPFAPVDWSEGYIVDENKTVWGQYYLDSVTTCGSTSFVFNLGDTSLTTYRAPCSTEASFNICSGYISSEVNAFSSESGLIVGRVFDPEFGASVWDRDMNYFSLADTLKVNGVELSYFRELTSIQAISDNGLSLAGTGLSSDGDQIAFLVSDFPEVDGADLPRSNTAVFIEFDDVGLIELDGIYLNNANVEISDDLTVWGELCSRHYGTKDMQGFEPLFSFPVHYVRIDATEDEKIFLRVKESEETESSEG